MLLTVPEACGWSAGPHWPASGGLISQYEHAANSGPLLCLLRGAGRAASQAMRRKTAPVDSVPPGPFPGARLSPPSPRGRLVFAAHEACVAFIFQQLEQI